MEFLADIKNLMLPEATLLMGALFLCSLAFFDDVIKENAFKITVIFLLLALWLCFQIDAEIIVTAFGGSFLVSKFTIFFKELLLCGSLFTVFLSDKYIKNITKFSPEFFMLLLSATLGGMVLISSRDFVTMFISLELLSISSYILSGFLRKKDSARAALKYLITGAAASAVMLFGVSILYALSGSLRFDVVCEALKRPEVFNIAAFGGIFVISGLCFKLAAVPFYNWASDVYENAPLSIAAFLSTVSKIAGFAIIIRLIGEVFNGIWILYLVLGLISLITMTFGNFLALCENNIKKIMAYSSIAQAGYILAALCLVSPLGLSAAIFYLITYLGMNFAAWACIETLDDSTSLTLEDLKGFIYKRPYIGSGIAIAFASLAGLPIFVGFFSKFYIFQSIAFAGFLLYPFLFVVLFNTIVALFYYLHVIKVMFDEEKEFARSVFLSKKLGGLILLTTLFVLISGIFASPLISYSQKIAQAQMPAVIKYEQIKGTFFDNPQPLESED